MLESQHPLLNTGRIRLVIICKTVALERLSIDSAGYERSSFTACFMNCDSSLGVDGCESRHYDQAVTAFGLGGADVR